MDCEKCPIKEECEKENFRFFQGRSLDVWGLPKCPLVAAAATSKGMLKQMDDLLKERGKKLEDILLKKRQNLEKT